MAVEIKEVGNNIIVESDTNSFIFHKSFVNSYRGMNTIQVRRLLKHYYTRSIQDNIIRYLKEKQVIKTEV